MKNILIIMFSVALAVGGQMFLKMGMMQIGEVSLSASMPLFLIKKIFTNIKLFVGFSLFGISSFVWLCVLSKVPLSLAYPMVSMGYVLTVLLSWKVLGEGVSPQRWIALGIICLGVVVLSRS